MTPPLQIFLHMSIIFIVHCGPDQSIFRFILARALSVPKCFLATFCYIWLLHLVQKPNTRFSKKSRHLQLCWIIYFFTERASFIISLIGISNTLGRLITGAFVDLPWVSSLVVTNCSLVSLTYVHTWLKLWPIFPWSLLLQAFFIRPKIHIQYIIGPLLDQCKVL